MVSIVTIQIWKSVFTLTVIKMSIESNLQTRMEVVTRPQLIEAYTRIRTSKDDTFIQVYAQMDEQFKEVSQGGRLLAPTVD